MQQFKHFNKIFAVYRHTLWNVCVLKLKNIKKNPFPFEICLVFVKFCIDMHCFILQFQDSGLKKYCLFTPASFLHQTFRMFIKTGCFEKQRLLSLSDGTDTVEGIGEQQQ